MTDNPIINVLADHYLIVTWATSLLIAAAIALAANRWFRLPLVWAFVLGAVIFGVLVYPIHTHAVLVEIPRNSK